VAFGNDFGNKAVVSLQTLVMPIDLAEEVRFELTEDFHPRQFSRLVHSTALPLFLSYESRLIQDLDYKEVLICPSKYLAIARLEVSPGDSKPYRLKSPSNPCSFGVLK
jgi:hypothetical protein